MTMMLMIKGFNGDSIGHGESQEFNRNMMGTYIPRSVFFFSSSFVSLVLGFSVWGSHWNLKYS